MVEHMYSTSQEGTQAVELVVQSNIAVPAAGDPCPSLRCLPHDPPCWRAVAAVTEQHQLSEHAMWHKSDLCNRT